MITIKLLIMLFIKTFSNFNHRIHIYRLMKHLKTVCDNILFKNKMNYRISQSLELNTHINYNTKAKFIFQFQLNIFCI